MEWQTLTMPALTLSDATIEAPRRRPIPQPERQVAFVTVMMRAMVSERMQRQIAGLLDEAEAAVANLDWPTVHRCCEAVCALDPENADAAAYLAAADRAAGNAPTPDARSRVSADPLPASFVGGRYRVIRLLGRGGRKKVYLARDERLGREVAFAVIQTFGLSPNERERALREARVMAQIGSHPNLVSIFDMGGEDGDDLFTVQEFVPGGDVGRLLAEHPPVARTLAIAKDVCRALSAIHGAGIVHRDLKPANVFLSNDGSARVGDLGLAATAGLDRITQHGTMVGTVAYMPPEQALGGDATPRSDLYSLGAMLYELVTGKPPFVGDDPTAVISQHINVPPVAPSWHTEDCPPALEALILQLLEKDPLKRPASATEVLAALEPIDPTQKSTRHSDESPLARLARGVFVGREKELERLRQAFDEAFAGRGGLVMLVGEPGIGKTRTTQELETYARMRGAMVLWGRTHEASGAPPYWPWIQIGNQWAAVSGLDNSRLGLASETIGELGRIFPALKSLPNYVAPPDNLPFESAQFLLFDAYASFLQGIAREAPLVVALEDLHWADKPTLQLLQHVAREVGRSRILIVGNYRDTDITRKSTLSETLAVLNRESGFERILLRGLSREEVAAYIRAKASAEPRKAVLDRIYEETEGNAFFLSEVVNLMAEEGTLSRDSISDIAIPDGVREALGRRLNRLSAAANDFLQVAAVIGREFAYDTLAALGDRAEQELLSLLEEGLEARVLEELPQPGRYRFAHAQMQETLLAELSTTRRVRLHGQAGEALERRWGERADERAAVLAGHFVEAALLSPRFAERAAHYAKLAAEAAESQAAWDEAARWYEQTLAVSDQREPGAPTQAREELLLCLGRCQRADLQSRAAFQNFMQSMEMARERDDRIGVARAAAEAVMMPMSPERRLPLVQDALTVLDQADPFLEARLLLVLPDFQDYSQPSPSARRVRQILAEHDFPDIEAALLEREALVALHRLQFDEGLKVLARANAKQQQASRRLAYSPVAQLIRCLVPIMRGDLENGVATIEAALAEFGPLHARLLELNLQLRLSGLALARGEDEALERMQSGMHIGGGYASALQLAVQAELRGDIARALALLPDVRSTGGLPTWVAHARAARCRVRWLAGDVPGAEEELRGWQAAMAEYPGGGFSFSRFYPLTELGDALAAIADDSLASTAFAELELLQMIRWDPITARGADAIAGQLGLRLGELERAERRFRQGLEWSTANALDVEAGRNLQGLAEVAVRKDDSGEALSFLDRAAVLFRKRGARLYLDRVIARKVELQGITSQNLGSSIAAVERSVAEERPDVTVHAAPDGTVAILFSDIENSTVLNQEVGDRQWLEVLHAHNAVIDTAIALHGGRTVKTMGDGYMTVFASAESAARCALSIQRSFANPPETLRGVRVRIGVHVGQAVRDKGDFFGREVNYAARVANVAAGGEVVLSEAAAKRLAGVGRIGLSEGQSVTLKGFAGEQQVFRATTRQ